MTNRNHTFCDLTSNHKCPLTRMFPGYKTTYIFPMIISLLNCLTTVQTKEKNMTQCQGKHTSLLDRNVDKRTHSSVTYSTVYMSVKDFAWLLMVRMNTHSIVITKRQAGDHFNMNSGTKLDNHMCDKDKQSTQVLAAL